MHLTVAKCCELSAAHSAEQIKRVDASDVDEVDDLSPLISLLRLDLNDSPRLRSLEQALSSTSNSLKHLVAARCPGLSSSSSSSVLLLPRGLSLPRLRVVDLTSCGLRAFDASPAPKLAALILTGNPGVTVSGLARCAELATLVVKNCDLTDEALQRAIEGCKSLAKLSAAQNRLRGGERLDLSALRGTLSELRLGHNDLRALPKGLSPRLRLLDAGGNAKLGPLRSVTGELSRIASAAASGTGGSGSGGSWLRSVTLRGTAAALERGYESAVAAAAPSLKVLDDKKVDGSRRDGKTPPAAVEVVGAGGEEEQKREKKKRPNTVAVGKLADETGLSIPPPPPLPEGQRKSIEIALPPPPPLPATPEAAAAAARKKSSGETPGGNGGGGARVIEVVPQQQNKKAKTKGQGGVGSGENEGGVATGKEAARLLAAAAAAAGGGEGILEEVGGW